MNHDTAERLAHAWMTADFKTKEEAIDALLSLPNSLSAAPQKGTVLDMPLSPSVSPALSEGSRQDAATGPCPKCHKAIPAKSQSGLCWCVTWQQEGNEGECPDCQHYNHVIDCPGPQGAPSWEIQTPNLRDRLDLVLAKARDTISPIERGIWLIEAQNLCERLVDRFAVCSCGLPYDALSERCEACDERHEQLIADRARFGAMALDIDERCGF